MGFQKLRERVYTILPRGLQRMTKAVYYDKIIFPLYNLKYKINYGIWDFFDSIAIETTTYCRLRCKFCPNSKYERGLLKNKKIMDINLFKKIINELSEIDYQGQILLHFYGEPLTDERLPDLVRHAREKLPKAKIQINTNGFLLTIPLYKKLINYGVNSFFITQYRKTIPPNIKKLMEYLKTRPKRENKIKYRILGKNLVLSNRGGEIKINKSLDQDKPACTYPDNSVIVDYLGDVILCCNDYHSSIKFGNLKKEKLINIWNKSHYKNFRKEIRKGIFRLPICKKCVGILKNGE